MSTVQNQKVQFYASKKSAEAKELASSEPGSVCFTPDTHEIIVDGVSYGGSSLSDWEKNFLQKKYEEEVASKMAVSISLSASNVVPGTTVTATVTVKYDNVVVAADLVGSGVLNGVSFTRQTNGSYTAQVALSTLKTNSFGVSATYTPAGGSGITKAVSASCGVYNKIHYGASASDNLTTLSFEEDKTVGPRSGAAGTYTFSNKNVGYYYLFIPTECSVGSSLAASTPYGVEGGAAPVYFTKLSANVTISGVTYARYRIADKQAAGASHTVVFS